MSEKRGVSTSYKLFKSYVRFYHDNVCYTKVWNEGMENVPADGTPLLIVSNHQNGVSDPLGIVMSFRDRKPNIIARADVFALHPLANKFLRAIGLLPAFRIDHEGEESLGKNADTFLISERALLDGETVAMYPEAGHQDKRWLGTFSYGYTKLAFEAAEMGNFQKEIYILPACNHYSDYFGIRNQMMIRYGTPIALSPYYELYKTKPRTAQRQVNKLVREQISSMMLNIEDLEHYDEIDFLRLTYGVDLAKANGVNVKCLPDMLEADKKFVAVLADASAAEAASAATAGAAEAPSAATAQIYADTKAYRQGLKALGIEDRHLAHRPSLPATILKTIAAVILFPLWLSSLWPGILMYAVAKYFACYRMKDRMMESTFLIVLSIIFWIPLFSLITLLSAGFTSGWLKAIIWTCLFPVIFIFAWDYAKGVKKLIADIRCLMSMKDRKFTELQQLRQNIRRNLDQLFKKRN